MPVYLRRFYMEHLVKEKQKEKTPNEKASRANRTPHPNEILSKRFKKTK